MVQFITLYSFLIRRINEFPIVNVIRKGKCHIKNISIDNFTNQYYLIINTQKQGLLYYYGDNSIISVNYLNNIIHGMCIVKYKGYLIGFDKYINGKISMELVLYNDYSIRYYQYIYKYTKYHTYYHALSWSDTNILLNNEYYKDERNNGICYYWYSNARIWMIRYYKNGIIHYKYY